MLPLQSFIEDFPYIPVWLQEANQDDHARSGQNMEKKRKSGPILGIQTLQYISWISKSLRVWL